MKKKLTGFLILLFFVMASSAQKVRLNAYSAYVFDDAVNSYYDSYSYYDGKIKGGYQWGVGVEYMIQPSYCIELMYLRQDTKVPITYQNGISSNVEFDEFDLGLNYILIGGEGHRLTTSGKVEGYGGAFLGIAIMDLENPRTSNSASETKFAWGARLGASIWASDRIGIKLQAQLLSIAQGAGGGFYFGTGGTGVGLSTYSSIYQFGLGGGLSFRLGNAAEAPAAKPAY